MKHKKVFASIEYASKNKYRVVKAISEDETQLFEYELDQSNYEIDVQRMLSQLTIFCKEKCGPDVCQNCEVYLLKDVSPCDTLLSFLASVEWATLCCLECLYDKYVLHTKPINYYKKSGKLHKVYYKELPIPNALHFSEYINKQENITGPHLTKAIYNQLIQDVGKEVIERE